MASIISAGTTSGTSLNLSADTSGVLQLATNGTTTAVTIDTSQRVGIGTSSPAFTLDVRAATSTIAAVSSTGTNSAYMFVSNTGGDFYLARDNSAGNVFGGGAYSANLYSAGAYPMVFWTNGSERMRLPAAGGVQAVTCVSVGNATPASTGAGITFPATQSASSDANTLDDYEEGTWTPALSDGTTSVNMGTSWYVKIGQVVTVYVQGYNTNYSAIPAGNTLRITGLPFTGNSAGNQCTFATTGNTSASVPVIEVNGTAAFMYLANQATDYTSATRNNLVGGASGFSVRGVFTYRASS